MTEAYYGTGTAEPSAAPAQDAGDSPGYDKAGLGGAGYDGDAAALAAEDQLPARQDSRAATWGDNPDYDETDLSAEYDGDAAALAAEDQLPARQESRAAIWGDNPEYDESDLGAGYDGDLEALAAEDQLPARQESRAATWGDNPDYDETDLSTEHDGDLDALTGEDHSLDSGDDHALDSGKGDQDQAATGKPDDPPGEAPGVSAAVAPEREDGNGTAPGSSPAGASADTSSVAEADAGERPPEAPQAGQADALTGQAAQPGDGHADPGTAPEAGLKELKAEVDASTGGTGLSQPDASTEAPARNDEGDDGTPDPYEHQAAVHATDGTDVPVTVEHMPPEARTVGDTTPTGIGRKPTGAEIFDMEGDDPGESRLDRLFKEVTDDAQDARDAATNIAETMHDLRLPGPALGGGHVHEGYPVSDPPPSAGPGYSDLVGSAVLVGVAMLTGIRYGFRQLGKGDRR